MLNKYIFFIPSAIIAITIFLLSTFFTFQIQFQSGDVGYFDKIEHCFAYFALTFSFLLSYRKTKLLNGKIALLILISTCIYGFTLELTQYLFFPNRYFEWIDAGANMLGSLIAYGIFGLVVRI